MKNNYGKLTGFGWLIMLVSAVSLAFFSQAQTVSPPQIQWQRTIEKNPLLPTGYSSTNDMPVRVAKIGDQEYGVLTSGAELVRLSSTGNPIWSTLIVDANSGYFRTDGVIATQDGGFMVLALTTGNWRLIKYNANGVVEKTYSPFSIGNRRQYSTTRSNLITTSDNGILVLGNRWDMLEGQITVVVAKFDSNISQSWETEISFPIPNPPVESKDYTNSVKALNTPDGGYLLVGSNGRTVNGPTAGWAVKLNGQGNQVWQKRYEDISAIDDVIPSPFSVDTYITIGRGANDPSLTQITTISSNGNVVEKSTYPGRATGTSSALVAVPARNGVPAYLTLMDVSSQNNGDIRLTAINAQNEVSWTKTLGGSGKEKGQAVLATDDGGYITVGTTTSTDGDVTGKTTSDEATWVVKLSAPVSTPTSTLKLTQPTYNCNTGIITFNTSGGDGSPITYTAPGITRSSPTSNTGVIEQGLRNDPKSITIQATQHGYTTSYIFDLKASCTSNNGPYPPVLATPIQNLTLTVGQSLDRYRVNFNFKDPNSHHGTSFYLLSFEATNTPPGLYFFDDTDSGTGIGDAYFTGTPTKPGTYLITVTAYFFRYTTSSISTSGTFTITVIDPSVNPPAGGDLKLTQPTYDCATGAITFNTTGGDGSPITYSAPGITRSSASSNTGVVEQGLRNDPKPITIQATQSGYMTSYTFDLKAYCTSRQRSPLYTSVADRSLEVGKVVLYPPFEIGQGYYSPSDPNNYKKWSISATGLPPGLSLETEVVMSTFFIVRIGGTPTTVGVYPVMVTAIDPQYPNDPYTTRFTITVVNSPTGGTLTLTQPTYDCATGAITFKTTGGGGSPIEFRAIGITDWTTNPSQFVDRESRTASDVQPFTLMARQSGQVVTYTWDLKAACGRARVGAIESGQAFSMQLLGNPVQDQVNVQIRGAEGQSVQLRLTDLQGRLLESRTIEQAKPVEEQQFWLHASAPKLLLLQAATPQQVQTVKIIKQ
ncbi:hypothetical protein M0L20_10015 [Spirosoma sp. RP8]|uniref:T9SS type A sorting domain-containing protein n=1 Tax=Spirosoma liriopis TaxID=2937440 RepID=A0ABT0HJ49_9BACT|nr:hypothetical protein [Spirosoma liriopis]MCK8492183.1 hypothetical protein [Spirosoma liriopis]